MKLAIIFVLGAAFGAAAITLLLLLTPLALPDAVELTTPDAFADHGLTAAALDAAKDPNAENEAPAPAPESLAADIAADTGTDAGAEDTDRMAADVELRSDLAVLRAEIGGGQRERLAITARLDAVDDALTRLQRQLRQVASANTSRVEKETLTSEKLLEAGFSPADADYLTQRWGERAMELMYLRDQARREGWIDSRRYRNQRSQIRDKYALDQELGDEEYDRFLYATGAPNRVEVVGVFEASPAAVAGLQSGDVILSYGDAPVRSGRELRDATGGGELGEPTPLLVERNGGQVLLELPRGPIGVRTRNQSVLP